MAVTPTHRWATFAALSGLFFLVSAGTFSSLGVVLPAMVKELNWNWTQAGLGYTFLGLACGLSSLAAAAFVRRLGVRMTLAVGGAMLVVGFGALAITGNVWVYLAATLVIGVAFSLVTVPGTHVLTGLFVKRSTILGAYFTIGALGGVAGPLLYVAIAPAAGWRAYWWVFSLAALALGAFGALTTTGKERARQDAEDASKPLGPHEFMEGLHEWSVRRALATPQFYIIVGAYTMYLLINTTAHGFAVEHLTERGVSPNAAAEMLSLEALIGAGVAIVGGWAGEKVKPRVLMIVALVSLIIGMSAPGRGARDVPDAGLRRRRGHRLRPLLRRLDHAAADLLRPPRLSRALLDHVPAEHRRRARTRCRRLDAGRVRQLRRRLPPLLGRRLPHAGGDGADEGSQARRRPPS